MIAARFSFWLQSILGVAPEPAPAKPITWPRPIRKGIPVCWDIDPRWESLPIINLPSDAIRTRRRLRQGAAATIVVRTTRGVRRGVLRVTEDSFAAATSLTVLWDAVNVSYP